MKKMFFIVALLFGGLSSCSKHEVALDFNAQLQKDVTTIDSYLAKNNITAVKDPSGLRYVITTQGTGLKPAADANITVKYTARFLDTNAIFDQSNGIKLALNTLIDAWKIGVVLMNKGSKFTLYVPSGLGYGSTGAGSTVPPNANLIFEIELFDDDAQLVADLAAIDAHLDSLAINPDFILKDLTNSIRYVFTTKGTGAAPLSTSTVTVIYTGYTLYSDTYFTKQTSPQSIPIAQLLEGWQLALPLIPVGSNFTLWIPSGLGYGPAGYNTVGPNQNLKFEINLTGSN